MEQLPPLLPIVLACTAVLTVAGIVKGVISLGLPLVGLPLLMLFVDVQTAVALLMVPLVLSNLLQAVQGEGTVAMLRRFWPVLICIAIGALIGTALFAVLDRSTLLLTIGILAVVFATASLLHPSLFIPPHVERWIGPPVGFISGVIGGMSTLFGQLLAIYVVGLRLPRDLFVKAISLMYVTAATFLMIGGTSQGTAGVRELMLSTVAMIPVYIGMLIGQRIRQRVDPERFRLLVLGVVWVSGANLIRMGLGY